MQEQHEAKEKILQAARHEFAEKGYASSSISNITTVAGVNKAMVNYYYGGKKNLYRAVLDDLINNEVFDRLDEFSTQDIFKDLDIKTKLYCFLYTTLSLVDVKVLTDTKCKFILREMLSPTQEFRSYVHDTIYTFFDLVYKLVAQGIKEKEFKHLDHGYFLLSQLWFMTFNKIAIVVFQDTPYYDKLCKDFKRETIREVIIENFFKVLAVEGQPIMPKISPTIKKKMDKFIADNLVLGGITNV